MLPIAFVGNRSGTAVDVLCPTGKWFLVQPNVLASPGIERVPDYPLQLPTVPGWIAELGDNDLQQKVNKLKEYLQQADPPNDYGRLSLLWAATRIPDLLTDVQKHEFIDIIWRHQREDGGWSLRTFPKPEDWGKGNRAERLRVEPDFDNSPTDGHMTGLAVLVLRVAGVVAIDPRIQAAVRWLKTNQRESGR